MSEKLFCDGCAKECVATHLVESGDHNGEWVCGACPCDFRVGPDHPFGEGYCGREYGHGGEHEIE